jgi:hypothetical protein
VSLPVHILGVNRVTLVRGQIRWKLCLGGRELYVDIETYISFCCTVLRELGGSPSRSPGWGASGGRLICRTNLNSWVAGDAASRHSNSTGQYGHTACRNRDAASWTANSADHAWVHIAERNSEHDGTGLEFASYADAWQHHSAVDHKPQHAE